MLWRHNALLHDYSVWLLKQSSIQIGNNYCQTLMTAVSTILIHNWVIEVDSTTCQSSFIANLGYLNKTLQEFFLLHSLSQKIITERTLNHQQKLLLFWALLTGGQCFFSKKASKYIAGYFFLKKIFYKLHIISHIMINYF